MRILAPQPGIAPLLPAVESESEPLDHKGILCVHFKDGKTGSKVHVSKNREGLQEMGWPQQSEQA